MWGIRNKCKLAFQCVNRHFNVNYYDLYIENFKSYQNRWLIENGIFSMPTKFKESLILFGDSKVSFTLLVLFDLEITE
jgi:hypothetical protein